MVETRRRTYRASLPSSGRAKCESPGYGESCPGVRHGASPTVEGRASKRRKTGETSETLQSAETESVTTAAPPRASGKRREIATFFTTMPLDILHEILGYLAPRDLLSVARTNSSFRGALLDDGAKATWLYARQRYNAPSPPKGFNEARWASLLFEPSCMSCGETAETDTVDWLIRKRLCSGCRKKCLAGERSFRGYDIEMFDCIPHTHNRSRRPMTGERAYATQKARLYRDIDVDAIAGQWNALKADSHTADGSNRFDEWKRRQMEYVASCNDQDANHDYEMWELTYDVMKAEEEKERQLKRIESIGEHFEALGQGYEKADIEQAFTCWLSAPLLQGPEEVTEEEWEGLRQILEPTIRENAMMREEARGEAMKTVAIETADLVYQPFLDHMHASERYLSPSIGFLRTNFQGVLELVAACMAKKDDQDSDMIFDTFLPGLIGLLRNFMVERKKKITRTSTVEEADEALSLARNVYFCENSSPPCVFSGWPSIAVHAQTLGSKWYHSFPMGWRTLELWCHPEFDRDTSKLSSTLIELAGLDPATATIENVDEQDARFVLMKEYSGPSLFREPDVRWVFTWRGALQYFVDSGPTYGRNVQPIFRLADEEEAQAAREHTASLEQTAKVWSCNRRHCQEYYGDAVESKPVVQAHLKAAHDVSEPTEGLDYVVHPGRRAALETRCQLPGSPFEGHEEYRTKEESPGQSPLSEGSFIPSW